MAEEKGVVNENLEAVLEIRLINGSIIECVIDTGFNGSLLLPRNFVEANSMFFVGSEEVELAEEIKAEIETALADIKWLDEEFSARIFVSEAGEALIGTEMLADTLLEIDYSNRTVKITK
jgi:clan AA aspartic protease